MVERTTTTAWTANRILALALGIVLTLVGILGFFMNPVFGFQVDIVHNLIHLVSGLLGIAAAYTGYSRRYNQAFGIIYLLITILGFIPAFYFGGKLLGIVTINTADNFLHLGIAIVTLAVGFFVRDDVMARA